jgi:two-component sensor histidine kinase
LSNIGGGVGVSRRSRSEGWVAISWRETGGPPVQAPTRRGFGTRLLATALQAQGGEVRSEFAPDGFAAELEMPID